jgi:hypothetical protein
LLVSQALTLFTRRWSTSILTGSRNGSAEERAQQRRWNTRPRVAPRRGSNRNPLPLSESATDDVNETILLKAVRLASAHEQELVSQILRSTNWFPASWHPIAVRQSQLDATQSADLRRGYRPRLSLNDSPANASCSKKLRCVASYHHFHLPGMLWQQGMVRNSLG